MTIYEIIGITVIFGSIALLILLILSLILGKILLRKNKLLFPKLLLFTLDVFYGAFKKFAKLCGINEDIIDQIGVEVRNKLNENKFKKIDNKDKLLILPHCLRDPKCKAKLSKNGLECKNCGHCVIGLIKKKAEEVGYRVFIVPGSSFAKRILKENKCKAVLGVACYRDLNISMMKISNLPIVTQGVPLLKDGCFKTEVDVDEIFKKIGIRKKLVKCTQKGCNQTYESSKS